MGIILVLARERSLYPLCLCLGQPGIVVEADLVGGKVEDILELGKSTALSDLVIELGRQDVDEHLAQGGIIDIVPHTTPNTQPFTHVYAQIFHDRAGREVDEGANTLRPALLCTAGMFMIHDAPQFEFVVLFATGEGCSAWVHIIVEDMAYASPKVIREEHEIVSPKAIYPAILDGCPSDPSRRRPDHVQQSTPSSIARLGMVMEPIHPSLVC